MDIALFRYSVFGQVEAFNRSAAKLLARAGERSIEMASPKAARPQRSARASSTRTPDDLLSRAEALLRDLEERDRDAVIDALLLGKVDEAADRYRALGGVPAFTARSRVQRLLDQIPQHD